MWQLKKAKSSQDTNILDFQHCKKNEKRPRVAWIRICEKDISQILSKSKLSMKN